MVVSHQKASNSCLADSFIQPLILFVHSLLVCLFFCSFLHSVVYCLLSIRDFIKKRRSLQKTCIFLLTQLKTLHLVKPLTEVSASTIYVQRSRKFEHYSAARPHFRDFIPSMRLSPNGFRQAF